MLVTRYLLKNILSVTVFIALTLTMVIWLTQSLKLLDLVANSDAPPTLFLKLVGLTLPRFLEIIVPLSLVPAVLFVYNKMISDNELIVMRSCGFDQMTLARPAIIIASALTVLVLFFSTYISPRSYGEVKELQQSIKTQYSSFLLREGVFNTFSDSLTVYLRARAKNGDLMGIVIHDTRDKSKPPVTITAKRGRLAMDGDLPNIIVFDGMRQQMTDGSDVISKLFFSRYTIEVKGLEAAEKERWREASERTLGELLFPDMNNRRDRNNRDIFLAEAQHRLVTPFNTIGFTLVALAVLLTGPINRRGQSKKVMAAAVIVIALQASSLVVVNAARKDLALAPALYIMTFLPLLTGLFLLSSRGEQWVLQIFRRWRGQKPLRPEAAS